MRTLRRARERLHERKLTHEAWSTFHPPDRTDQLAGGLASLELLREGRLLPRAAIRDSRGEREVITYVREGAVTFEDSNGRSGVIEAGEFQRMTASHEMHYRETNPSPTRPAHVFQLWLRLPDLALEPSHELKRFSLAERRGRLCVVASPDGRDGSLHLHQDAVVYSSILQRGRHLIHELAPDRSAFLHVVSGALTTGGETMEAGDGLALVDEPSVALSIREPSEILLLELGVVSLAPVVFQGNA